MPNKLAECYLGNIEIQRSSRMVLDPLTEVGIRVFVAVMVGRCQFVMHILRDGERSQPEQNNDHSQGDDLTEQCDRLGCTEYHQRLLETLQADSRSHRKPAPN